MEDQYVKAIEIMHPDTLRLIEVGSTAWGISTGSSGDDLDVMGIHTSHMDQVLGLEKDKVHTWRSKPKGVRSEAGDIDYVSYSLHKFFDLALGGNPTIQALLYTDDENYLYDGGYLDSLNPDWFRSQRVVKASLHYANNQYRRLTGSSAKNTNRPELVEKYGYDTKFAAHAMRLLLMTRDYLITGRLQIPLPPISAGLCKSIRDGEIDYQELISKLEDLEKVCWKSLEQSKLPKEPNWEAVNDWCIEYYLNLWY